MAYSKEDVNKWAEDYKSRIGIIRVSKKHGVRVGTIRDNLRKIGVLGKYKTALSKAYLLDETYFFENVSEDAGGCINWVGSKNNKGYGTLRLGDTWWLAHRYSYFIHLGEIGEMLVCHKCDNPSCVNPDHLFLGTNADNMRDMATKLRGSKTKLTPTQVQEIRILVKSGWTTVKISKQYGVTERAIYAIRTKRSWAWL